MKKIFLFTILIFFYTLSWGQLNYNDIILDNGNSYSKVFNASSSAKSKHLNAKEWVAKTFGDYKSVLQFEDDENYKLIIKGFSNLITKNSSEANGLVNITVIPKMSYTLTIDCKDDKYRIKIEDINFKIDRTFSVLGNGNHSTTDCDYFTFIKNDSLESAAKIMIVSEDVKRMESIDTSSMKKKELEKHNLELETKRGFLLAEAEVQKENSIKSKGREMLVKNTICELINSLSNSIEHSDDF